MPRSETAYRGAEAADRRAIRAEVVTNYRGRINAFVKKLVPPQAQEEAEHEGVVGLLIALEKLDPSRVDDRFDFWTFALPYVRDQVQKWRDHGVYWRPRTRKARPGVDERIARGHRYPLSADAPAGHCGQNGIIPGDTADDLMIERLPAPIDTVEDLVADMEAQTLFEKFVSTLDAADQKIIRSENAQCQASRRYSILVRRAQAFVQGSGRHGSSGVARAAVSGRTDTIRP